jgi:ribonucleotide reductase alpha subunit
MSYWSRTILEQKYSHDKKEGGKETWDEVAERVGRTVLKAVGASKSQINDTIEIIKQRKFIPGGRYLYATGRQLHQTQNCLLMRAGDSREGWSELLHNSAMALMTGAGIGIDYSQVRAEGKLIRKTGGFSTGPLALMEMVNDCGRKIQQGGSRRSAIWAGLNWSHPDIHKFITMKNWIPEVREMKAKDFNFPATMDGTNISVLLDDEFFKAIDNDKNPLNSSAQAVYWATVKQMLKTAEPGFSIDCGKNNKETLRNACVPGSTEVLTSFGYQRIDSLIGKPTKIWNGFEWSTVTPKQTGTNQPLVTVTLSSGQTLTCTNNHEFEIAIDYKGTTVRVKAEDLQPGMKLIKVNYPVLDQGHQLPYAYTQGFISAEGMDDYRFFFVYKPKFMCINRMCLSHIGKENRERISAIPSFSKHPKSYIPFDWCLKSKLDWLAGLLDGDGTLLVEGGVQICSINEDFLLQTQKLLTTMGTPSKVCKGIGEGFRVMPDGRGGEKEYWCQTSYRLMIGSKEVQDLVGLGLHCERLKLEGFTPNRSAARFVTVSDVTESGIADEVFCFNEPLRHLGCFEGVVTGQCTEITSADDSDVCNLGSINLARIETLAEMERVTELATSFLLAGTVYSDVPYAKVDQIRTKNRRLGLGLMGIHEWLLVHGKQYSPDTELEEYLKIYTKSDEYAAKYAKEWDLSIPIKTRAIAPNGTISIVAETTSGIEPIYCVAYKRRYLKGSTWHYQYVIDPTAKRLIESGLNPESIEDAYVLAGNVERRVAFQAWVQKYVDHAISSTINIPAWGSELNNDSTVQTFGKMLLKYLPSLRGITCYPDGGRSGQPLSPCSFKTAIKHTDEVFVEAGDVCSITKGESCGS